jgi:metal-responsive CopG/Arc/MetJ family transcriptional regulator
MQTLPKSIVGHMCITFQKKKVQMWQEVSDLKKHRKRTAVSGIHVHVSEGATLCIPNWNKHVLAIFFRKCVDES